MYIIAGLGNPGSKYDKTRHNAGFEVMDKLAKELGVDIIKLEHKGLTAKAAIVGKKCILVKPQTFMNCSGECINRLAQYYGCDPESELLVISDDVTLDCGRMRIRRSGSAGGHNGLKDIIAWTDTDKFARLRVGVGKLPQGHDMVNHVLGCPSGEDRKLLDEAQDRAVEAIKLIVAGRIDDAMNKYN